MADTATAPAQAEQHVPPPRIPGIASIKPEYVLRPVGNMRGPSRREKEEAAAAQHGAAQPASGADVSDKHDSKRSFDAAQATDGQDEDGGDNDDDAAEAAGVRGDGQGKKKARRGQNKARKILKQRDEVRMCNAFMIGKCGFGKECRFSHDLSAYVAAKERDLTFMPQPSASGSLRELTDGAKQAYLDKHYSTSDPFVLSASGQPADTREEDLLLGCIDTSVRCPVYDQVGECPSGWKCRYLGGHVRILPKAEADSSDAALNGEAGSASQRIGNVELLGLPLPDAQATSGDTGDDDFRRGEKNYITKTALRELKARKYPLTKTRKVMSILNSEVEEAVQTNGKAKRLPPIIISDEDEKEAKSDLSPADIEDMLMNGIDPRSAHATQQDGDSVAVDKARVRPTEKKRLDWRNKLYLAPLTTTGNLPFRRLCASFGSDIHCGEMGLAESYLNGQGSEWSLIRRWEGERIFGTQICGSKPNLLVPAVEALVKEVGSGLDFVDLNCGCPIDLVYKRGAGSALLDHPGKLGKILRGVNAVLGEIPLTIKLRTGTTAKNTTHKLFSRLQTEWGVSAATLHGRSRKQRYKNLADWDYIKECADTLRESVRTWNEESRYAEEPEMVPVPIFGNGDVYSWEDYRDNMARTGVDGEMVARGALIKPWVFTEIKEQRTWDISSRERLDMYRQYAEYAISHWGSDTQGVNTARRYFCEALSFTHRYVPAGILEHLPPRLNDRPPVFRGRDELETLLASSNSADWVKISEMFFGKAPETWHFIPKHKSNSYEDAGTEQQG
ncbi:tRNA-dihydrouridine synthase 3 [Tilletia horrida]|nr:tRNA-dihydrouridine synthase 3 [Tilletia horrida]